MNKRKCIVSVELEEMLNQILGYSAVAYHNTTLLHNLDLDLKRHPLENLKNSHQVPVILY